MCGKCFRNICWPKFVHINCPGKINDEGVESKKRSRRVSTSENWSREEFTIIILFTKYLRKNSNTQGVWLKWLRLWLWSKEIRKEIRRLMQPSAPWILSCVPFYTQGFWKNLMRSKHFYCVVPRVASPMWCPPHVACVVQRIWQEKSTVNFFVQIVKRVWFFVRIVNIPVVMMCVWHCVASDNPGRELECTREPSRKEDRDRVTNRQSERE